MGPLFTFLYGYFRKKLTLYLDLHSVCGDAVYGNAVYGNAVLYIFLPSYT
jgi:hypothetical protein